MQAQVYGECSSVCVWEREREGGRGVYLVKYMYSVTLLLYGYTWIEDLSMCLGLGIYRCVSLFLSLCICAQLKEKVREREVYILLAYTLNHLNHKGRRERERESFNL